MTTALTAGQTDLPHACSSCPIAVTGWSVYVPGFDFRKAIAQCAFEQGCTAGDEHELLGKRGLLYKEPATRLALCAVHRALKLPPLAPRTQGMPDPKTAVVASSNFGNMGTIHKVVRILEVGSVRDVSPFDAPNVSSNVMASTVAIWFRFGGPNLMVCSGATSGLDAVKLGCILLRAGRADRVIVVGAEPDDDIAAKLYGQRSVAARKEGIRLRAGAACVVLQCASEATTDLPQIGPVRFGKHIPDEFGDGRHRVFIGPLEGQRDAEVIDLTRLIGDTYGALGVMQVAAAATLIAAAPAGSRPKVAILCGDPIDGWRSTAMA